MVKNYVGMKFGRLTVLEQKRENRRTYCHCLCECGNKLWIRSDSLTSGKTLSCGCYNRENNFVKIKNLKGKKFGRLTVIEDSGLKDKRGCEIWKCKCDCGNVCYVLGYLLSNGGVKSCGCLAKERAGCNVDKAFKEFKERYLVENTNISAITRTKLIRSNKSGLNGIYWDKTREKWVAQIGFQGKSYKLGRYENKEDAIKIRKQAEEKIFGEFLEWYYELKKDKKNK